MAKKKLSRKELLKGPDEFLSLSARVSIFVREHSREFQYLGMGLAAAVLIYLGINTYLNHVNKKGQEAYNQAYYAFAKTAAPNANEENLREAQERLQKVIDDHGMAKVSDLAPPSLAYLKYRQKEYDEAISLFQQFLGNVSAGSPYQSLAKLGLAACWEEKGAFEEATGILKDLVSGQENLFRELAMLSLARIYRLSGKRDQAISTLKEFVEQYKTSSFLPLAKAHLEKLP